MSEAGPPGRPRTEAGRALAKEIPEDADGYIDSAAVTAAILAIEDETEGIGAAGVFSKMTPAETGLREAVEWTPTRELRIEVGPVVIAQTRSDPGDMGEPRVFSSEGVTYVTVPDFDLWQREPLR